MPLSSEITLPRSEVLYLQQYVLNCHGDSSKVQGKTPREKAPFLSWQVLIHFTVWALDLDEQSDRVVADTSQNHKVREQTIFTFLLI